MTTSVDIQGMQLAQQDFQLALDQMNSIYSEMDEERDTLTANWAGMAASAFGQALTTWLDDLYQIRQELVVMTESLSTHTGIYSNANETSQEVVAAFQQGQGLAGLEGLPDEPGTPRLFMRSERLAERELSPMLPAERIEAQPALPLLRDRIEAQPEMPLLPRERIEAQPEMPLLPRERIEAQPALPLLRGERIEEQPAVPMLAAERIEAPLLPDA